MVRKNYKRALSLFLLILVTASTAKQSGSAVEQLQSLRAELRKSHASNDWHANLASANKLKKLLNEAPRSLLEVARADVFVGDQNAALHELEQFVRMGQSADLSATSADFSPLLKNANFTKIQSGMEVNRSSISLGSTAFLMSDSGLLAEDVDYDPHAKRFFITSVREKKIVSTDTSGATLSLRKRPMTGPCWP